MTVESLVLKYHSQYSTPSHFTAFSQKLRQTPMLPQVLVMEMLRAWGDAGLRSHVEDMQRSYHRRASVTLAAAEKHLKGLASWRAPEVGIQMLTLRPACISERNASDT